MQLCYIHILVINNTIRIISCFGMFQWEIIERMFAGGTAKKVPVIWDTEYSLAQKLGRTHEVLMRDLQGFILKMKHIFVFTAIIMEILDGVASISLGLDTEVLNSTSIILIVMADILHMRKSLLTKWDMRLAWIILIAAKS